MTASLGPVSSVASRMWRPRWRDLGVLALLVAVAVGGVVALLTGSLRASSAQDRLRSVTRASDVQVYVDDEASRTVEAAQAAVARVDGVLDSGVFMFPFVRPAGSELYSGFNLLTLAPASAGEPPSVDRPVVVRGRMPDQDEVDQVAVGENVAASLGVDVGDRLEVEATTPDLEVLDLSLVDLEVVGVIRSSVEYSRVEHLMFLTPAFVDRYAGEVLSIPLVAARVDDELASQLNAGDLSGFAGIGEDQDEMQPSVFAASPAVEDGLGTIEAGLVLVAGLIAVAGAVSVGLACLRVLRDVLAERTTLAALGWTRGQLVRLGVATVAPWMLGGAVLGVAAGLLASPQASIGLAHAVDPDPDAVVLAGGRVLVGIVGAFVLGAVLVAGAAVVATWSSTVGDHRPEVSWPRLRSPLWLPIGVRRALFGARDRGGRASRGAAAAATAAVALAVGGLLIGASIQRLQDDPFLSGQGPVGQRVVDAAEDGETYDRALATLEADARAVDLVGARVVQAIDVAGDADAVALVHDVRRGDPGAAVLEGRLAVQPDEVALGPSTADALGADLGDEVELVAGDATASFRVVGILLFPEGDFSHDHGMGLTPSGAARLLPDGFPEPTFHQVAFTWAPDVDAAAADEELAAQGLEIFTTGGGLTPAVVTNLGEVRSLPILVTVVVVALGLLTLLHAVSETGRRRAMEASALRALGMTRRNLASVTLVHGASLAALAIAVGTPLGVAAGRTLWATIAGRADVLDHPVIPWWSVVLVAAVVTAGTFVLLIPSVRRSGQRRVADLLRAE